MVVTRTKSGLRDMTEMSITWEDPQRVWTHPSGGYSIVTCNTQWDYELEGYFLAHCLGTKRHSEFSKAHMVYSLRDSIGVPHATILCLRPDEGSPYGMCWDVGSYNTFTPEQREPDLRILQVRGRNDEIAHPVFHAMVREWYTSHGGRIDVDIAKLVNLLLRDGDSDVDYHFRYLLDEAVNGFTWAWWNHKLATIARAQGLSL